MKAVFAILAVQALLGGFDNFWHHELHARLPQRASARRELALHAAREAIYAVVFLGLAWTEWHGALAVVMAALLLVEVGITLADFLEEDRSRRLPPFERVLHTVLAITYGLFLATLAPHLAAWASAPTGLAWTPHGVVSWAFTACAARACSRGAFGDALAVRVAGARRRRLPALAGRRPPRRPHPARGARHRRHRLRRVGAGRRTAARRPAGDRAGARPRAGACDVRPGRVGRRPLDAIPSETAIDAVVNLAGARVLGLAVSRRAAARAARQGRTA